MKGPINNLPYGSGLSSSPSKNDKPFNVDKCGSTTFKFRTDLYLTANKEGAKGAVSGEIITLNDGSKTNYGSQSAWGYDWQKCVN